jgi:hypothetical protein
MFVLYNCLWVVAVLPWVIHDSDVCDMRCCEFAEIIKGREEEFEVWVKQMDMERTLEEGEGGGVMLIGRRSWC